MADGQLDLIDYIDHTAKLFKAPGTSARAAASAARYARGNFMKIRTALLNGPLTPDEVARITGINLLTARPRMSDLANPRDADGNRIAPFITGTGIERSTACGKSAEAMRLTTPSERKAWRVK